MRKLFFSALALAAGLVVGFAGGVALAWAQDAASIAAAACADNGQAIVDTIAILGGSTFAASLLANFAHLMPWWLRPAVNVVALNWRSWLRLAAARAAAGQLGRAAALLLLLALPLTLGACQVTGDVKADTAANLAKLQAFAPEVDAYNKAFVARLADFNQAGLAAGVALGRAGCGYAAMLDGQFQLAKPILLAASADPKVGATEAVVFGGVQLACALVDAADPAKPATPQVAAAVAQVVDAIPKIESEVAAAKAGS